LSSLCFSVNRQKLVFCNSGLGASTGNFAIKLPLQFQQRKPQ
jgi:hypothetical protein